MVMSVMDKHAITSPVQSELSKCYPDAKEAPLKVRSPCMGHVACMVCRDLRDFPIAEGTSNRVRASSLLTHTSFVSVATLRLQNGGNFPYLARDAEVTMYIRVHLRQFAETRYSAGDDFDWSKSRAEGAAAQAADDGGDAADSQEA